MAEILGLGMTHYPGLYRADADMTSTLYRTLAGKRVPAHLKDPANWPAPMRGSAVSMPRKLMRSQTRRTAGPSGWWHWL